MCSNMFDSVKEAVRSFLHEFCPCLMNEKQDSGKKEPVRENNFMNQENKIFTIETIKKRHWVKKEGNAAQSDEKKECLVVENVPWDTEANDMFLRVGRSIFPVHQFLLSIESEILKTIIESVAHVKNATTIVTLNGYEADEIKTLLTFVYLPESEINDGNINILLKLADELMLEELVIRCEDYLLTSQHSPISLLNLAFKYQLPSLEESAAIAASKIPGIDQLTEFKSLSTKQQQKVIYMAENRYRSGQSGFVNNRDLVKNGVEDLEQKSPEMKLERKLNEKINNFRGSLAFLPEIEKTETVTTSEET